MPNDSSQPRVQSLGSDEGSLTLNELMVLCTTLSKKVKDLQSDLTQTKLTYGVAYIKLILRVKKLEHKIDQNPSISLVQDKGTSWIQEDAETQGRISANTDILFKQEEPTKLVEDLGSGEKGEKEISIAEVPVSTASTIPVLSTAIPERQKKTKKQLEQERLRHEEAIRLQEQINEEEIQRIARDAGIAKQLQEEIDIARQEQEKYDLAQALELQKELDKMKEVKAETTQAHDIDWSDPVVLIYHAQQNRSFSKAEVRKNMYQNQAFVPKDSKIEKEVVKRPGFDLQKQPAEEEKLQKKDDSSKPFDGSRKKTLARKKSRCTKRQKIEDDIEKEELKAYLDLVPREEFVMEIESLGTKYPLVDWKTHVLTENFMYYQIFRADGSSKNYKIFSEMLDDFDRQDVLDLHRLVEERYATSRPEGYDLMLWGDLKILFQPDEEDEVWRHQHEYNLISWRLFDSCGIHILLMDNGIAIHMMIEKKYPLTQEMLSKMLSRKLEVDHENEMAFELLRFIRSQVQK
ncbi:hypothetical protein Tco_1196037 [Tanacetum coccineum]